MRDEVDSEFNSSSSNPKAAMRSRTPPPAYSAGAPHAGTLHQKCVPFVSYESAAQKSLKRKMIKLHGPERNSR
jgi:hypothetical protein